MQVDPRSPRFALLIAVFSLSLAAVVLTTGMVQAQVGLTTVEGQVLGPDGDPVAAATVELSPENNSRDARSTQAGSDGAYSFSNVEAGTYVLVANHDCCAPASQRITIEATETTREVDLELTEQKDQASQGVLVHGVVRDVDTGEPAPGITLTFENWFEPEEKQSNETASDGDDMVAPEPDRREGFREVRVRSGEDGSYAVELSRGEVSLQATASGYDRTHGWFQLEEDREVNVPVRASQGATATVHGELESTDGDVLNEGWVSVSPDHRSECDGDVCYAETTESRSSERYEEDGVSFHIESSASGYDRASVREDGSWVLTTRPGPVLVSAWAPDHLNAERSLELEAGENRSVELALQPIPPDSVTISGQVLDAESGEPIPYADVQLENAKWGHWNHTRTDEDGRYTLTTKPGYTIVTLRADENYWVPCEADDEPKASSGHDHEASDDPARSTVISPGPYCEPQQREHAYLTQSRTYVFEADERQELDTRLERRPSPDATFQGWAINASDEQGVPEAQVTFWNEETNEWGQVTTDEDGSYAIDVRAGYFTVRVWADGYYQAAENVRIASGETRDLVLELTPGQARHGYCCFAIAEDRAVAAESGMDGDDARSSASMDAEAGGSGAGDQAAPDGDQVYEGRAGGLGAYDSSKVGQGSPGDPDTRPAPGPAAILLVSLIALAAYAAKRRGA